MVTFPLVGECGLTGIWSTITAARSFNTNVLQPPATATHYVRYTTGATAALRAGEVLTGGTSSATAQLIAQANESSAAGGSSDYGVLFLIILSGVPAAAGETWTGVSTGTVATAQAPMTIKSWKPCQAALITVETAGITFTMDGTTPTVSGGTNYGHQMSSGQSYVVTGWNNIKNFKAINTTNANGAIIKYSLFT